jgi:predicted dehydrogenase
MNLKVGIAGLKRGKVYVDCFREAGAEVTAFCATHEEVVKQAGDEFGVSNLYTQYEEFLKSDIDIVVVSTPLPVHAEQSIAALHSGKHVLSEVPPVNSLEEGLALRKAVKETKKKYMLAQNTCYWDHIQAWKRMIDDDRIGKVIYAEAEYIADARASKLAAIRKGETTWRSNLPPIYYCTHSLGPLLYLMKDRCIRAQGFLTKGNFPPINTPADMEVGIFKTEKGAVIKILTGFTLARRPDFHYYSVYGTKGCLETNRGGEQEKTLAYFDDIPHLEGMASLPLSAGYTDMSAYGAIGETEHLLVRDFVEAIEQDKPVPIGVEEALSYGLPGICAHQSATNDGELIEIP